MSRYRRYGRYLARYLACARMEFKVALAYRAAYLSTFVMMLLQIYLLRVVWTAFYGDRAEVGGVALDAMTAYSTLVIMQYTLFSPWRFSPIQQRVREGKVAVDLLRPVGFPAQMVAGQLGWMSASVPVLLVALPFALLVGAGQAPASPVAAVAYAVALVGALTVNQLLALMLGMSAFWTLETTGAMMMYRFVAMFFSGTLVPLFFMPEPLRIVAQLLPFQTAGYTPAAIYLGRIEGADVAAALAVQLLWIGVLSALAAGVWSRAQRRVMLQGG